MSSRLITLESPHVWHYKVGPHRGPLRVVAERISRAQANRLASISDDGPTQDPYYALLSVETPQCGSFVRAV
jgi:hypothetical protein